MDVAVYLPEGLGYVPATILVVASFFTSALTAAFGVGGGLAMLALMGIFVPVAALIPIHGAVQLGSNTGRAWTQRASIRWDVAGPFFIGSIAGAVVGAFFVIQLPDAILKLALGLFVIAITWARIPGMARLSRVGMIAGSAVLAVLSMVLGAIGPLLNAFLAKIFEGDRKGLVATHAAGMTVQHLLKVIVFSLAGFGFASWAPLVAAMIVSGYLGTVYGTRLLERMPEETFAFWFRIGLTLLAADMVRRGAAGLITAA